MSPERSDYHLHLMQCHDDSLKEALKQTLFNQENLFRKQVQELHRLYQIQMILMKKLRFQEVAKAQSLSYSDQDCRGYWSKCLQIPLDLEVPASCYANNTVKHKGNGWGTAEKPIQVESYFHGEPESSLEEVKLSLGIGGDILQKRSSRKTWDANARSVSSELVVELEESTGRVLSKDVEPKSALSCATCSTRSGNQSGFHSSCSCLNSVNKDLSNKTERSPLLIDSSMKYLEQNSFNPGVGKRQGDLQGMGLSVIDKAFTSHGAASFDLNEPQPDQSPFYLEDCTMVHSSSGVSEGLVGEFQEVVPPDASNWRKPNDICSSSQVSPLLQLDTPNSVLMASNSSDNGVYIGGSKLHSIDLESCTMSPSDGSEDRECLARNSHKDADMVPNSPNGNCKGVDMTEVNGIKGEEVLVPSYLCRRVNIVEDLDIDRSPESSKSDPIIANPSGSLKTMQSGIYVDKSISRVNSFQNSESSQVESSGIDESKLKSSDDKKGESAHDDPVIKKGAVSLIYFMLESSAREHDCVAVAKKKNDIEKGDRDQPECSFDTFESTVLKLQECNADDCAVSSNPYEVNDMDKKDYGNKLRRGRRMKDFQKDILPGLASLSRHEICEDIRIMEGAIRSREYKRLRSKMTSGQNWLSPVRSRRSRLNYVGRRYYK